MLLSLAQLVQCLLDDDDEYTSRRAAAEPKPKFDEHGSKFCGNWSDLPP